MRIIFELEKLEEGYTGTMQSPDQSDKKIPVTSVIVEDSTVVITITQLGVVYKGVWGEGDTLTGTLQQMGNSFELNLDRKPIEVNRPQEPVPPFPYRIEEVTFRNEAAGITLAGTLTLPEKPGTYPAVILVTGSGPQNRDEEILRHKPFWVLADYLTREGIIVLRYDERGVGESEGNYMEAGIPEFADDALAAVNYLKTNKEVDKNKTGIIGHSEGGCVAFVLGGQSAVSFIVTLAGPGVKGGELLNMQREAIYKASGISDDYIALLNNLLTQAQDISLEITDPEELKERLEELFAGTILNGQAEATAQQFSHASWRGIISYDPAADFKKTTCPVLALNGAKDLQVPSAANLSAIKEGISANGNKQVTTIEYPELNHLFQTAVTGLPAEYGEIEETISPTVLKDIADWITGR